MAAKLDLRIEPIGEAHIGPYIRMAVAEYGPDAAIAQETHLRWKFLGNPAGPATGIHLYSGDQLVGRYIYWPRQFSHAGRSYRAAIALDTLIDKQHRHLNTLMKLLSGLKQISGFDLLLSIAPNGAGWQVSKKFLAMPECLELDVAVAPIGPASIVHKRGTLTSRGLATALDWPWRSLVGPIASVSGRFGRYRATTEWPSRASVDALFAADGSLMLGDRSYDFVDWRFRRSPHFKYEVQFLYEGVDLVGYVASRRANYEGYDCRFLVDVFGRPGLTGRDWLAAIGPMLGREARNGSDMSMLLGTARCGSLAAVPRPPYLRVPARFMPRRMTVFCKWLAAEGPTLGPDNLYLTLADYDVV